MASSSDPVWWKRRPLLLAGLALATGAAWAALAVELRGEASLGPERATYEGRGGTLRWQGVELPLPDLAPAPAAAVAPVQVFRLRGRPWAEAVALLGQPAAAAGELRAWPSAVALAHPEPQQWPVAHVVARRGGDGRVVAVALAGSLGRILESDPGEPGYESGRADPALRSEAP